MTLRFIVAKHDDISNQQPSASDLAKNRGFRSLSELSGFVQLSTAKLKNIAKKSPVAFDCLVIGAANKYK